MDISQGHLLFLDDALCILVNIVYAVILESYFKYVTRVGKEIFNHSGWKMGGSNMEEKRKIEVYLKIGIMQTPVLKRT